MSNAEQEPSVDDVLASIREMIRKDSGGNNSFSIPRPTPASSPVAPPPAASPAAASPVQTARLEEPILLTEEVGTEGVSVQSESAPATLSSSSSEDHLVSGAAEQAGMAAFASLEKAVQTRTPGRSVEDIAREMLHPMLKEWMDRNLPIMIERLVRREIERIAGTDFSSTPKS